MAVLDTKLYKQIEWRLYNYHALKRKASEYGGNRTDILFEGRLPMTGGGGGTSRRSDPSCGKALRLVQLDNECDSARRWVDVIELVIERYNGIAKGRLLQMLYFEELGREHISARLNIERSAFFSWRDDIVTYTAMAALEHKLINSGLHKG